MEQVRVVIADDDGISSQGLQRLLSSEAGIEVVGVGSGAESRDLASRLHPDILLVDSRMKNALGFCAEQAGRNARPWVILLAAESDDQWAVAALRAGARGLLTRTSSAEDLVKALRVVHDGQIWARASVVARALQELALLHRATQEKRSLVVERLSTREREVLGYAASGLSNKEIAARANISHATVKAHLTSVFQKLGLRDRVQLAALYSGGPVAVPGGGLPGAPPA